jgi:hypothetical protein
MEFFRALKTRGVPVRFVRYPREKHGIGERAHQIDLLRRILDWLDRYLKAPLAATSPNGAERSAPHRSDGEMQKTGQESW